MFCALCRRLFWRDPKPSGAAVKPKQNARSPQGGGEDPKQCPSVERVRDWRLEKASKRQNRVAEIRSDIVQRRGSCQRCGFAGESRIQALDHRATRDPNRIAELCQCGSSATQVWLRSIAADGIMRRKR
jgi:hypothetical protein